LPNAIPDTCSPLNVVGPGRLYCSDPLNPGTALIYDATTGNVVQRIVLSGQTRRSTAAGGYAVWLAEDSLMASPY
jgi:hypothetical protein